MVKKEFTWSEIEVDDHVLDYYVYYGKEELGHIEFYPPWKKLIWIQGEGIVMSESCLKEVLTKMTLLTEKSKPINSGYGRSYYPEEPSQKAGDKS